MYLPYVASRPDRQDFAAVHEEDQAQELAVDAAQGRHERRQENHVPVAAICVTIIADLVGSGALEDVARVVGVAELAFMMPSLTSADEIVAEVDVHQRQHACYRCQHACHTDVNMHVTDVNMHVTDVNMHVTGANMHVTDANMHVTDANMHVTDVNMHVTDVNMHVTDVNMHVTD